MSRLLAEHIDDSSDVIKELHSHFVEHIITEIQAFSPKVTHVKPDWTADVSKGEYIACQRVSRFSLEKGTVSRLHSRWAVLQLHVRYSGG
jgi:hypothetical protein